MKLFPLIASIFLLITACVPRRQMPLPVPAAPPDTVVMAPIEAPGIIIDSIPFFVDTLQHFPAGPGSWFSEYAIRDSAKPLHIFVVKTHVQNPWVSLDLVMSHDSVAGNEQVSAMARRKSAPGREYFAGINADFYRTRGHVGHPIQGAAAGGQMLTMPNHKNHLVFDSADAMRVGILQWRGSLRYGGSEICLDAINDSVAGWQHRLLNSHAGRQFRNTPGETAWLLAPETGERFHITAVVNNADVLTIPERGFAIDFGYHIPAAFRAARAGELVNLSQSLSMPEFPDFHPQTVTGAHDYILKNGQIWDKDWAVRHPRSSWGSNARGDTMILCVVDGRSRESVGVTTWQLAQIMHWLGAAEAVNLDGGGSSTLFVSHSGVMNKTSDGRERAVANGLYAVSRAPADNNVASIAATPYQVRVAEGDTVAVQVKGFNTYGHAVPLNDTHLHLTVNTEAGRFIDKTHFISNGNPATILVEYLSLKTEIFLKPETRD